AAWEIGCPRNSAFPTRRENSLARRRFSLGSGTKLSCKKPWAEVTVFRIAEHPSRPSRLLTHDGWVLFGTRIVRLFAYGLLSVVLALYLSAVGLSDQSIGVLLTLTLVGDALVSLVITRVADRVGRRRMLLAGAGLMILAGGVFALTSNPLLLILVAFVGTLSPSGNEVGSLLGIEEASVAHITPSQRRTHVFAWYNLVGSFATALGALSSGLLTNGLQRIGSSPLSSYRALFALYAGLGVILVL